MATPFPTRINLPDANREAAIAFLNARTADAIDLWSQAKHAHWNVKGAMFLPVHQFFDEIADKGDGWADTLAERVAQLGGIAEGRVAQVTVRSTLRPAPETADIRQWLDHLAANVARFANNLRIDIANADKLGDVVTSNILQDVGTEADKLLWFIDAHLQTV